MELFDKFEAEQACVNTTGCKQCGGKGGGGYGIWVRNNYMDMEQEKYYFPWILIAALGLIYYSNGSWKNEGTT